MAQLEKLLEESRRELLDLSTRNRLLSTPVESKSARVIHVRDEKSDVVFRLLVDERKAMGFLPGVERKSKPPPTLATVPIVGDFKEEEEITLMNWGNAIVEKNNLILNLNGNFKTTQKKILWISKNKNVSVKIISYSNVIDGPQTNYFLGEFDMINLKKGDYVQLMKMNYYMCLSVNLKLNEIFLIEIP